MYITFAPKALEIKLEIDAFHIIPTNFDYFFKMEPKCYRFSPCLRNGWFHEYFIFWFFLSQFPCSLLFGIRGDFTQPHYAPRPHPGMYLLFSHKVVFSSLYIEVYTEKYTFIVIFSPFIRKIYSLPLYFSVVQKVIILPLYFRRYTIISPIHNYFLSFFFNTVSNYS